MGYGTIYSDRCTPAFLRNLLPPSSGRNKQSSQQEEGYIIFWDMTLCIIKLFASYWLLGWLLHPEDGSKICLRNFGECLPDYVSSFHEIILVIITAVKTSYPIHCTWSSSMKCWSLKWSINTLLKPQKLITDFMGLYLSPHKCLVYKWPNICISVACFLT
jgi:hypothetical protein